MFRVFPGEERRRSIVNFKEANRSYIWGALLIVLGALLLLDWYADVGAWIWILALAILGCLAFIGFLRDRSEWGWLIPAYVLWAIALLILLVELNVLRDEGIAVFVLLAIALPFLVVFLLNRANWWGLIPAYTLAAVAVMVGLIGLGVLDDMLIPAYVMFAIALPFIAVFVLNRENWWALIPAGIMAVIGLSFLIASGSGLTIVAIGVLAAGIWLLVRGLRAASVEDEAPQSEAQEPDPFEPEEQPPTG
jgi:hypothetical protein